MGLARSSLRTLGNASVTPWQWLVGWGRMLHTGAMLAVLAVSPAGRDRARRSAMARQIARDAWPLLPGFVVLATLVSVVLIRIVLTTAAGYGLSQYALEAVLRVLVMELIPLIAAAFVALRCAIPHGADVARLRRRGELERLRRAGFDPLRLEVLPRAVASGFAVLLLAAVSGTLAMLLAYLAVYGLSPTGFGSYTRMFGQVFAPAVTLVFIMKIVLFALAVAVLPLASALNEPVGQGSRSGAELRGLVRVFAVLLVVEVASLAGNYT